MRRQTDRPTDLVWVAACKGPAGGDHHRAGRVLPQRRRHVLVPLGDGGVAAFPAVHQVELVPELKRKQRIASTVPGRDVPSYCDYDYNCDYDCDYHKSTVFPKQTHTAGGGAACSARVRPPKRPLARSASRRGLFGEKRVFRKQFYSLTR